MNIVKRRFLGGLLTMGLCLCAVQAGEAAKPALFSPKDNPLPSLPWENRSDWLDVKEGFTPKAAAPASAEKDAEKAPPVTLRAVGDGKADDTAALQAALNTLVTGSTLHLPAGTYRITATLTMPDVRNLGIALIGHGRDTVIVWDGAADGVMFLQNTGCAISRFIGITWDGRDKAAVGMDFSNKKYFETEQLFRHSAFLNFTEAGIRMGLKMRFATAETLYDNCFFARCAAGIALRNFNVLDHTIVGCEFRGCGVGIYSGKGSNFYARACRFAGSTEADIVFLGEAGSSVRRSTSQGSRRFVDYRAIVAPLVIQDCRVDAWKESPAVAITGLAPVLMMDTVFTNPPSEDAPIRLGDNPAQRLLLSNNRPAALGELVSPAKPAGQVTVISGDAPTSVLTGPEQSFLKTSVPMPGKIFDAKRDFGAKGDGKTDDTAALAKALAAARAEGKRAMVYLPKGKYAVTTTLTLTGADHTLEGVGYGSALIWKGAEGGAIVEVVDPQRLAIKNLCIGSHDNPQGANEADIIQKPSKKPSTMLYDRIRVFGMYQRQPMTRGYHARNLGKHDRVYFRECNGNIRLTDSADATVFLGTTYEGSVVVDGTSTDRGGFLGGGVRLGTCCDPALWVKDNHSFVFSDFYAESGEQFVRLEGNDKLPAGRVVMQGAKFEIAPKSNQPSVEINNYRGALVSGTYQYYPGNPVHRMVHTGQAPFSLTLWGSCFYNCKPGFEPAPKGTLATLGNNLIVLGANDANTVGPKEEAAAGIADANTAEALTQVRAALDDLRRLGQVETEFAFGDLFE